MAEPTPQPTDNGPMTREQALAELAQMINMKQKLEDQPDLIRACIDEADRQLRRTPGTVRLRRERLFAIAELLLWERCAGCGKDYAYPHLCRDHMLCGLCHPPMGPAR